MELSKKKIVLVSLSFLLVFIVSVAAYFYHSYGTIKEDNSTSYSNEDGSIDGENLEVKKEYNEAKGITNILLLGIDDRGTEEPIRSDTIMILTLDDINKKMKLTSIMRDTYVEIPGYGSQKLNHAFAYGGVNLMAQTIQENFNISLERYVKINFDGFKDLAESVGGLDVNISNYEVVNELNRCILLEIYDNPKSQLKRVKALTDSAGLLGLREEGATLIKNNPRLSKSEYDYISKTAGFVDKVGDVHLNGIQLLAYSRMRHVGAGSYERTERQRNVVNQLIDKLKDTPQTKYLSIVNKLLPYVKTNIGITDALNLVYTTYKINNFTMEQLQMPATKLSDGRIYKDKGWVLLMDKEENNKMLKEFIFDNIKYDEAKYLTFNYKKSEYYYEILVTEQQSNKIINEKEEEAINDKKNNSSKEDVDIKTDIKVITKPTKDSGKQKNDEESNKETTENSEIKNGEIKNGEIKNGEIKNEEIKNEEIKNDEQSNIKKDEVVVESQDIKNVNSVKFQE